MFILLWVLTFVIGVAVVLTATLREGEASKKYGIAAMLIYAVLFPILWPVLVVQALGRDLPGMRRLVAAVVCCGKNFVALHWAVSDAVVQSCKPVWTLILRRKT